MSVGDVVKSIVGGYLFLWVIAMGSTFFMLLISFLISLFTSDATIMEMVYFLYNGSVGVFIIILAAPIGFAMVVLIPVWNAVNDFIAPLLAVVIDPIAGGLSGIFHVPYTKFSVTGVIDQNAWQWTQSFRAVLDGFKDFLFDEVVG